MHIGVAAVAKMGISVASKFPLSILPAHCANGKNIRVGGRPRCDLKEQVILKRRQAGFERLIEVQAGYRVDVFINVSVGERRRTADASGSTPINLFCARPCWPTPPHYDSGGSHQQPSIPRTELRLQKAPANAARSSTNFLGLCASPLTHLIVMPMCCACSRSVAKFIERGHHTGTVAARRSGAREKHRNANTLSRRAQFHNHRQRRP
jgi:hypothetical protein